MPPRKRCPNGTRKNRKTGECSKKTARKRCPNGTRKNRKTGECSEKTSSASPRSSSDSRIATATLHFIFPKPSEKLNFVFFRPLGRDGDPINFELRKVKSPTGRYRFVWYQTTGKNIPSFTDADLMEVSKQLDEYGGSNTIYNRKGKDIGTY